MTQRKYRYRVNFGNGQVHELPTKAECFRFIAEHTDGYAFVQWQDPDTQEWFKTGSTEVTA